MNQEFVFSTGLPRFQLWDKIKHKRVPLSFTLELTARCNNNCRHCYINLPAGDQAAQAKELSREEIRELGREAVSLGALWCLLTGGEPLLREDFTEIYLDLKRMRNSSGNTLPGPWKLQSMG
jgi:MoaA/NifB/PqqE/SkfB family radical SAM enzyme